MKIYLKPRVEHLLTIWPVEHELAFYLFITLLYDLKMSVNPGMGMNKAWDLCFNWITIDLILKDLYYYCLVPKVGFIYLC